MSSDSSTGSSSAEMSRQRRGSITSGAFTNLFQRSNSISTGTSVFPGPITPGPIGDQRRRLSINTLGLSGTSPASAASAAPFSMRRGSMSTNNSDSIDENAVDEDDMTSARTAPTTPFTRRMSLGAQAMRNLRAPGGTSPGSSNDQGFNWSEQLRSRAESTVASASRPSFAFGSGLSTSPPRGNAGLPPSAAMPHHDRAKSVSDMLAPPAQAPKARQPQKPDPFQERILKGDFYMD